MKYSIWVVWLAAPLAVFLGEGTVVLVAQVIFWSTLLAHLAEFVIKRALFERVGGSMTHHFVQTMLYGLFYWAPIQKELKSKDAGAA